MSPLENQPELNPAAAQSGPAEAGEPQGQAAKKQESKPEPSVSTEQQLEELRERYQRLGADYQNYQKRSLRQIEQAAQLVRDDMARSLLGVLDNFNHTLEKGRQADQIAAVLDGIKIVYDHLMTTLAGQGLKRIEVQQGEPFDPTLHEAVFQEETEEYPPNTVLRELAAGYVMHSRTLRPAKVSVATPPKKTPPRSSSALQPQTDNPETDSESGD